jgi:hypothetical protein
VIPAATELVTAVSSVLEAPPPRLMLATAGVTWFCVTQSIPATTPDVVPAPVQSRTRTGWIVTFLATPCVVPPHRTRGVHAVAVALGCAVAVQDGRVGAADAPGELDVGRAESGVENVGMDSGAVRTCTSGSGGSFSRPRPGTASTSATTSATVGAPEVSSSAARADS